MCGLAEAMAVMSVMQSIQGYQTQRAAAKAQTEANKITEQNANIAYLNDIQKIEGEKVEAAREFALEDFKRKMDLRKKQSQALNLGFGNPFKVIQDLAGTGDTDYVELQNAFLSDMYKANYQYTQAYADMQQTRAKYIKPVTEPSLLGLGLEIGTTAVGYGMSQNAIINQSTQAEIANRSMYGMDINAQRALTGKKKLSPLASKVQMGNITGVYK
jgi:hypothetical protein